MSLYRYRCERCDDEGRPVTTRLEAEEQRATHRRIVHGGLVPPGERIERLPSGARDPDARYVSSGGLLALLAVLAVASLLARALGH